MNEILKVKVYIMIVKPAVTNYLDKVRNQTCIVV